MVVTSVETNISKQALTDENGRYTLLFRDGGGRYQAVVSFLGFAEQTGEVFRELGPTIQQSRQELQQAMQQAQKILTSEQWKKLPKNMKNAARPAMRAF